jgi:hypothetical protein
MSTLFGDEIMRLQNIAQRDFRTVKRMKFDWKASAPFLVIDPEAPNKGSTVTRKGLIEQGVTEVTITFCGETKTATFDGEQLLNETQRTDSRIDPESEVPS